MAKSTDLILKNVQRTRLAVSTSPNGSRLSSVVKDFIDTAFFERSVRGTKSTGNGLNARLRPPGRNGQVLERLYRQLWTEAEKSAQKAVDLSSENALDILDQIERRPQPTKKQAVNLQRRILHSRGLNLEQRTELLIQHVRRSVDSQVADRIDETVQVMKDSGVSQTDILARFKRMEAVKTLSDSLGKLLERSYTEYARRVASNAETEMFKRRGYGKSRFTWVTVNAPPTLCPDCSARHGVSSTLAFWGKMGKPGAGRTICGSSCYCALLPKEYTDESPDAFAVPIEDDRSLVVTTSKDVSTFDKRGPGITDRKKDET